MEIDFKFPKENNCIINNLAFVRALMIKKSIENLEISYTEKLQLKEQILKRLQNT